MNPSWTRRTAVAATLLGVASLMMAGCAGTPAEAGKTLTFATAPPPRGSWAYPHGDVANTRDAPGSSISSTNVSMLTEAWTFKLEGTAATGIRGVGSLTAPPV